MRERAAHAALVAGKAGGEGVVMLTQEDHESLAVSPTFDCDSDVAVRRTVHVECVARAPIPEYGRAISAIERHTHSAQVLLEVRVVVGEANKLNTD